MNRTEQTLRAFALTACGITSASALPILSIIPDSASVVEGGSVSVDVMASGLDAEFIGDYDLAIAWDASLLALSNVSFASFLDGPMDSISGFSADAGALSIFEVSLGALSNQDGLSGFRLFTLDLLTLNEGMATIDFADGGIQLLGNELGERYSDFGLSGGSLSIIPQTTTPPPTPVPEPATPWLLSLGIAGVLTVRRRGVLHT